MEVASIVVGFLYFAVLIYLVTLAARAVGALERIANATERTADAHEHR